jgi:hypothetical protein
MEARAKEKETGDMCAYRGIFGCKNELLSGK